MAQSSDSPPDIVRDMGKLLIVRFEERKDIGITIQERSYDFRTREGRHAFLRFTSWALEQKIVFSCADFETANRPS